MLDAANLGNFDEIHNWKTGQVSTTKLQEALDLVEEKYSTELVEILGHMLEVEEGLRYNFITLEKELKTHINKEINTNTIKHSKLYKF